MNGVEMERLAMKFGRCDLSVALKFPREYVRELIVVAQRFAFGRLMFFTKMCATRFITCERIDAHQLGEFEKIGDASGALQRLIEIFALAGNTDFAPEFFAQLWDFADRFFNA